MFTFVKWNNQSRGFKILEHISTNLRSVNLNLLPVLRALLRHGSVNGAAREIGLSESATSTSLGHLRAVFGDPLLVKVGRTMKLTPRGIELIEPVERICSDLRDVLQPTTFDASKADRCFVVATPDYMTLLLGTRLIDRLARTAPRVRIQFVNPTMTLQQMLTNGEVDVAVVAINRLPWSGFEAAPIASDDYVAVLSDRHPLAVREALSIHDINSCRCATFRAGYPNPSSPTDVRESQLVVAQFTVLPLLALDSDIIAITPRSLAKFMSRSLPIKIYELPYDIPRIEASVIWSPIHGSDPAHRWFRQLVDEALHASFPEKPTHPLCQGSAK